MSEKKEKVLKPRKPTECRTILHDMGIRRKGGTQYFDALPRDFEFAYNAPSHYVTGFRIFDIYKTTVDFSDYRKLTFLEDPNQADKWGLLRSRIPYPKGRVTDLPGTRELHYRNYCLRNMSVETARSWRKSIKKDLFTTLDADEELDIKTLPSLTNKLD